MNSLFFNDEEHVMDSCTNFISFRNKNKFLVYIEDIRNPDSLSARRTYFNSIQFIFKIYNSLVTMISIYNDHYIPREDKF